MSRLVLAWSACITLGAAASAAAARIDLVLLTEPGFPATESNAWYQALVGMKVDSLQIRGGDQGARPGVETLGTPAETTYRVTGVLSARNELLLPGARFSARDQAGLRAWLTKLRTEGPAGSRPAPQELPFGLSPEQLATLKRNLAGRVTFSTRGLAPKEVVDKLAATLDVGVSIDRQAAAPLAQAEKVGEELQGLAAGAALAATLRPAALVLLPRLDAGSKLHCAIVPAATTKEAWPVGWPLEQQREQDLVPEMYELRNVELEDVPLSQVLEAIGGRLKLPILFDHNSLARQGIDPAKVNVRQPPAQLMYASTLRRALSQARLKYQMRLDEAGKPLVWVTTVFNK